MRAIGVFGHILLASDGSDGAMRAAEVAAALAQTFESSITVVHVVNLPVELTPLTPVTSTGPDLDQFSRFTQEVQGSVERRTGAALDRAGVPIAMRRENGDLSEVIGHVAVDECSTLIIVGSRGLRELKSWLIGSVSDRVIHHAHCPVLVVK